MPLAAALLASTLLPPPASARDRDTFEDLTEVIEVQVPVNVTDRDGEPIRGLTRDDFEILDSGDPQEITDLRVVDLDVLSPDAVAEEEIPSAARRHFLFLFDLSFSNPTSIVRARQAAQRFVVSSLHPTDLAAVATHSVDRGARLVVTFTPDRAQLARAIDTLGASRLLDHARRDPLRFVIESPENLLSRASTDTDRSLDSGIADLQQSVMEHLRIVGKQMERTEKSFARGRISSWTRSMGELARMLDSVKGRKHVVFFSEGFDGELLFGRRPSAADTGQRDDMVDLQFGRYWNVDMDDIYGNSALQTDVELMLAEFRRTDSVIQAVDISGLRADSASQERNRSVGQDALFYLADDTGGHLYEEANDFGEELERVLRRSTVTYLLSFSPSGIERDGSYHRLKVKVDTLPRGAEVSFRQGYYAPRPFEGLHPLEKTLLASDAIASAEPRRELGMNVLAAPFRATEEQVYVPVIIEIAGDDLLADHRGDEMSVELYAYVTDGRGEMRDFFTQLITLDLSEGRRAFARTGLKYYGHLELGPGDHLLRVLARNAATGRTGVATVDVGVPEDLEAEPILLPPFFLEAPGSWFLVRENQSEGFDRTVVYPFTVNGEPYIPAARPVLTAHQPARFCLVAYNLGDDELVLDAKVLSQAGAEVDGGSIDVLERTVTGISGLDKLLATFEPNGLEAGSYTLQVALRDPVTGTVGRNSIPFVIH